MEKRGKKLNAATEKKDHLKHNHDNSEMMGEIELNGQSQRLKIEPRKIRFLKMGRKFFLSILIGWGI